MRKHIIKQILSNIPLLLVTICLNFTIIRLAPGDPVSYLISGLEAWGIPPEFIQTVKEAYGLDKPIWEQLLIYIGKVARGDFGYSFTYHQPVFKVIMSKIPYTLLLTGTTFIISLAIGLFTGIKSAEKPYSRTDNANTMVSLVLWATPGFWAGMMSILVFAVYWHIFPAGGMSDIGSTGIARTLSTLRHLFLPSVTMGLGSYAVYSRYGRASMLQVLSEDYIKTAWSKGCTPRQVYYKHAFKNAMIPIVTLIAMRLPGLFMGSVLTETVFTWPGLGSLLYEAIRFRDVNLLMAIFIVYSVLMIISNIVLDIVYAYVDPRISFE